MKGNTFHSNQACVCVRPPPCKLRTLQTGESHFREGKKKPKCQPPDLASAFEPTQCFPTTGRRSRRVALCNACKAADFLDTRRGRGDSLHKHGPTWKKVIPKCTFTLVVGRLSGRRYGVLDSMPRSGDAGACATELCGFWSELHVVSALL